jgi:beta-amylase
MNNSLATMGQEEGWVAAPKDAGTYNSKPQETLFFKDGGGYSTPYGKFFLSWYSGKLIEHGGNVMQRARGVFNDVEISAKVR